jgi:hypothetical protein
VGKTVNFSDRYGGNTAITIKSAGTSDTIFNDLVGKPIESKNGTYVFVTFSHFQSRTLSPHDELEVKGSDGLLYPTDLSDGPDSGAALAGFGNSDPNHFTEAFDLPTNAADGAVLIVHEDGTDRDFCRGSRRQPPRSRSAAVPSAWAPMRASLGRISAKPGARFITEVRCTPTSPTRRNARIKGNGCISNRRVPGIQTFVERPSRR